MAYGAILGQNPVPSGLITLWYGSINNIPGGWVLCNGQNGTPDLRDRFIVGAGNSYNVGDTGGSNTVTLNTTQIPSHNHILNLSNLTINSAGAHIHELVTGGSNASSINNNRVGCGLYQISGNLTTLSAGNHTHTLSGTGTADNTGGGQSHENRPPYYALCYIMKL